MIVGSLLDFVPPANRFFINLDRRPDRRAHCEGQFALAGITPIRSVAVDGKTLSPADQPGVSPLNGRICTPAEVACMHSHRRLWELAAERGEPMMIFEDDVYFCADIWHHLRRPLALPNDYGIFYIGAAWREDLHPYVGPGIHEQKSCRTTHAYVISPEASVTLLSLADAMPNIASDHYTCVAHERGLVRAHIYLPFWAVQTNHPSDIGLRRSAALSFGDMFDGPMPESFRNAKPTTPEPAPRSG